MKTALIIAAAGLTLAASVVNAEEARIGKGKEARRRNPRLRIVEIVETLIDLRK